MRLLEGEMVVVGTLLREENNHPSICDRHLSINALKEDLNSRCRLGSHQNKNDKRNGNRYNSRLRRGKG